MPEITVNPPVRRLNASQVEVSVDYTCEGQASIAVTLSGNGTSKGGKSVTGPSGTDVKVTVSGNVADGECQAHAQIQQSSPPATDAFDGAVTVA